MRLTRRAVVQAGVVTLAAPALSAIGARKAAAQPPRQPGGMACRCSATCAIPPASSISTTSIRRAEGRHGAADRRWQTFDNLNQVVAGVKGTLAAGVDLLYDSLMAPALDEVSAEYGLLAESVSYPDDFSSVIYRLRANAKWHDGKPVTPEDVIFSFEAFKKHHPQSPPITGM